MVNRRLVLFGTLVASFIIFGCNSLWSQSFQDKAECYRVTVPPDWQIQYRSDTSTRFVYNRDAIITIAANPNQPPVTLEHNLEVLKDGGFGKYIESVENMQVDGEPALWVTISPELDYRFIVIVINPNCNTDGMPFFILTNQDNPRELGQFIKGIEFIRK